MKLEETHAFFIVFSLLQLSLSIQQLPKGKPLYPILFIIGSLALSTRQALVVTGDLRQGLDDTCQAMPTMSIALQSCLMFLLCWPGPLMVWGTTEGRSGCFEMGWWWVGMLCFFVCCLVGVFDFNGETTEFSSFYMSSVLHSLVFGRFYLV